MLLCVLRIAVAAAIGGGSAFAAAQPAERLVAMSVLEPGLWQLRTGQAAERRLCVVDPEALVQLRHAGSACARTVIANGRAEAVVHYSCPGAGWGRTSVRVASARSATVDTQGIADNAPFAFVAEARRIGDCPPRNAAIAR